MADILLLEEEVQAAVDQIQSLNFYRSQVNNGLNSLDKIGANIQNLTLLLSRQIQCFQETLTSVSNNYAEMNNIHKSMDSKLVKRSYHHCPKLTVNGIKTSIIPRVIRLDSEFIITSQEIIFPEKKIQDIKLTINHDLHNNDSKHAQP